MDAALRPGSTALDATVVALTTGGRGYGLRWLTVDEGIAGPLTPFPDRYPVAPSPPERADGEAPSVSWTPDGASVTWLEWEEGGETTLRTVGWDAGPGTGNPATDNAAFSLGPVPVGSGIEGWLGDELDTAWTMAMDSPDGDRWLLRVKRQTDGALALPGGRNPCSAPCEP